MTLSAPCDLDEVRAFLDEHGLLTRDLGSVPTDIRVATDDGRVVGTVAVERRGQAGLLRSVAVAPSFRNAGLGRQLVESAEAGARDWGLDALYLLTTDAGPFFERLGYQPAERHAVPEDILASEQFAGLCPASAVCLGKLLSPTVPRGTGRRRSV